MSDLDTGRQVAPRPVTPLGILAAQLEHVCEQIHGLEAVSSELKEQLYEASALASGLDPYLSRCSTPESPALRSLAERTHREDWSRQPTSPSGAQLEQEMLSGHIEGQFLQFLLYMTRATRVLDIGMFSGYSALAMAEALPDDGQVVACEVDPYVADFASECFSRSPSGHKISVRIGPARSTMRDLASAGEAFDVAFIDADKAGYRDYLDILIGTGLLAPGGVVCVDNTLMQGLPYTSTHVTPNGHAIAAFNRSVSEDPRIQQVMLPLRDGLTLIRRV